MNLYESCGWAQVGQVTFRFHGGGSVEEFVYVGPQEAPSRSPSAFHEMRAVQNWPTRPWLGARPNGLGRDLRLPSKCRSSAVSQGHTQRHFRNRQITVCYLKMLTARAITSPKMTSEAAAWAAIASLAQRASGITSVGLNAVESVKPRYR